MAKHMVKCLYCGEMFDASITPYIKPNARRYAHKTCAQSAEENKIQEEKDREALENYIKELFGINCISPKIKKQIETFVKDKNYSYTGILKTLKYFFEIRKNPIEKANGGIGIVPHVYDEAYNYWRALWEAKERNKQVNVQKFVLPVREVHIDPPQRQPMKHMRRLFTFVEKEDNEGEK